MGFRTLFDQRSRAAACWQGAREASELNPTLSTNVKKAIALESQVKALLRPIMNQSQFETIVAEAIDSLPDWVHESLDNIEVLVVEEPDEELDPEGERPLGLYMGLPLPERGADYAGELPDVVYIFRRPHLELALPPDELRREIARTLIHEIAHHFGIDDDRLEELGWG